MIMPPEAKEELDHLRRIVGDIHQKHREAIRVETEVFVDRIVMITNMYPAPILMTAEMAASFMDINENKGTNHEVAICKT